MDERTLRLLIADAFSEGELRTLCADLRVDYESLPAVGKADKARELIAYMARRGELDRLITLIRAERPTLPIPPPAAPSGARSAGATSDSWAPVTVQRRSAEGGSRRDTRRPALALGMGTLALVVLAALAYSLASSRPTTVAEPTAPPAPAIPPETLAASPEPTLAPEPPTATTAPTVTALVYVSPTPDTADIVSIALEGDNICTDPAIIPERLDPRASPAQASQEAQAAVESGVWLAWPKAPLLVGEFPPEPEQYYGFERRFRLTNLRDAPTRVQFGNAFTARVQVRTERPGQVNRLNACQGAGRVRQNATIVSLNTDAKAYEVDVIFPDGDYYTLEAGEIEIFSFRLRCDGVGSYLIDITIPFEYGETRGVMRLPTQQLVCPEAFTTWGSNPTEVWELQEGPTYRWTGSSYEP